MKRKMNCQSMKAYRDYLVGQEKSTATVDKYSRDVEKLYDFLPAGKWLDREKVLEFKAYLSGRYTAVSANSMIAAINSYFQYKKWEDLKINRFKTQKKIFCREEKEISKEEYARLLETAKKQKKEQLYLIMLTLCATGMRISELQYLTVAGIQKGQIEIYCKNKVRLVMLPKRLQKILLDYLQKKNIRSGRIFITRGGRPVDRSNIWKGMKRLCRDAGVEKEKVFPHNLRHLFARTYYSRQKDIVRLSDILGHSSIETTRIYTISSGKEHQQQICRLGLVI